MKILFGIIGTAILICLGVMWYFVLPKNSPAPKQQGSANIEEVSTSITPTDEETFKIWSSISGEQYDKNYIGNMIAHHEGAIEMAKIAQSNAKHAELKALASKIIASQKTEVDQMLNWQKAWGYPSTSGANMQDHSAMGMMNMMTIANDELKTKTGDEFDATFIDLMIKHHQDAIDMSLPGPNNALRQEVKDLAQSIITAQSNEVQQMKEWKKDWGY